MFRPYTLVPVICLLLPGVMPADEAESAPPDTGEPGSEPLIIELDDSNYPVAETEIPDGRNSNNGQIEFIIGGSSKDGIATRKNLPVID